MGDRKDYGPSCPHLIFAKVQLETVHAHGVYDIEVDTTRIDTQTCALEIKAKVESGIVPTAFRTILDQISLDKTS